MSTATNIQELEQKLSTLESGHRSWFSWWIPAQGEGIPFAIFPFSDKTAMEKIHDVIDADATNDRGVKAGVLVVSSSGRIHLLSSSMALFDLQCLAVLCKHFSKDHPKLGILKDACIDLVNGDGVLENRIEAPDEWSELRKVEPKGSTNHVAAQINTKLKPGQDAYLWVSGGGRAVGYTIYPVARDPDGKRFNVRVEALQKVHKNNPFAFRGMLRKKSENSVVISTEVDLQHAEKVLSSLYDGGTHDFKPREILLIQVTAGKVAAQKVLRRSEMQTGSVNVRSLNEVSSHLASIQSGGTVSFWFNGDKLVLAADTPELRAKVAAEVKNQPYTVGTLSISSKGFPVFTAKKPFSQFIERLADWVSQNYSYSPNLCHLKGARFLCKAKDGTVTDKQKNDDAWSVVPNLSN